MAAGLTQSQLAHTAAMSRAAVGALERGSHVPSVEAAIRVARALGATVEQLFAEPRAPRAIQAVLGGRLVDGALVRAAPVGEQVVVATLDVAAALGGAPADGVVDGEQIAYLSGATAQGAVVAGCDPLLRIAEGFLERAGPSRLVAVTATSGEARSAMAAGRCHMAVVHGPAGTLHPPAGIRRWRLATWRSGLAAHSSLGSPSIEALLSGDISLITRPESAACQQALGRAVERLGAGPPASAAVASGHLEAARWASERRTAAVTIEPVARAAELDFVALELHEVELWVPERWLEAAGVVALLDLLASARFLDRAGALPAYDLSHTGTAA